MTHTTDVQNVLRQAKALVQAGRLKEARALLLPLDDERARKWVAQIDAKLPSPSRYSRRRIIAVSVIALLLSAAAVFWVFDRAVNVPAYEAGTVTGRLFSYCLDVRIKGKRTTDTCSEWASLYVSAVRRDERVIACHRQSPTLDAPFRTCLAAEGITP